MNYVNLVNLTENEQIYSKSTISCIIISKFFIDLVQICSKDLVHFKVNQNVLVFRRSISFKKYK